jgi:peptide/nickel transport system permease protein
MKMIMKILILILECLVTIEVLICIGHLPTLFSNLGFQLKDFFHSVTDFNVRFFTFQPFTYNVVGTTVPLFPTILQKYLYSMEILVLGVLTATTIAFLFTYLTLLLFRKKMEIIKKIMDLGESIPDLIFILLVQMLVIFIYKKTGIRVAQVVSLNQKVLLLPIISLAVPNSFYIAKVMILYIEEEFNKDYVTLVKSKGFSFSYIFNIHVLRNIAERMFITSKTMIWTMLSTVVIAEKLFNMNALINLMFSGTDTFIIGCMLIFIPFFILYRIFEWVSFDNGKDAR